MTINSAKYVLNIFNVFDSNDVRYALLRDLTDVLPEAYAGEEDVDIIVHPEDWQQAQRLLKLEGWFDVLHPFDNRRDFTFLYGLKPFRFFIRGAAKLDICFQLACRSSNAGEWVPLDQEIQDSVWENRHNNETKGCYTLDPLDECVHLLARAFYDKSCVPAKYCDRLKQLYTQIDETQLKRRLDLVFFKAAGEVTRTLRDEKFEELVKRVSSFDDY